MFFLIGLIIGVVMYFVWHGSSTQSKKSDGSLVEKTELSGWDKLGNLVWFVVKCLLILWLLYWVLWVLVVSAFFYNINEYAKTPEGRAIIENNPYNNIEPALAPAAPAVPDEPVPTQEEEEEVEREGGYGHDYAPPEPAMAPEAPPAGFEPAPTQGEEEQQYNESDYNG